ncbi:MAG: hypothetical protein R3301_19895, partial [Saprospiraceae bacterium]|nr:hypothetical protein [Saprospiraceae bacterium]
PTNYTLNSGSFGVVPILNVPDAGTMDITYNSGSFDGEVSYNIFDAVGGLFFASPTCSNNAGCSPQGLATSCPEPCMLICPGNIIVDLGPGECSAQVSYVISSTGACNTVPNPDPEVVGFTGDYDPSNWTFTAGPGGSVDLSGVPDQIALTGGDGQGGGSTTLCITIPEDGQISVDWSYTTNDAGGIWDQHGYSLNGMFELLGDNTGDAGTLVLTVAAGDEFCFVANTLDGILGSATTVWENFQFATFVLDATITGPASGSQLEPGVYVVEATATDAITGQDATCSFTITVNAYNGPVLTSLACNDNVQISLNQDCQAVIGADEILEGGPYMCYDEYIVNVDEFGSQNVNGQAINISTGYHTVTVTDPNTGNSCWGTILVEDKLPPVLECFDLTLTCGESTDPVFAPPGSGTISASTAPGLPIGPDAGTITNSSLNIVAPAGAKATDVNLYLNFDHTWLADVFITLTSPSGQQTTWNVPGCIGNFPVDYTNDDEGTPITLCIELNAGGANLALPAGLGDMFPLDGSNVTGGWNLEVLDQFNLDGGTLNEWGLIIEYEQVLPFAPTVTENCGFYTLDYVDTEIGDDCTGAGILRTWTATDASGNTGTCVQTIGIEPMSLSGLQCPANYTGECGGSTDPSVTGYPTVNGSPIVAGGTCNIFAGYTDLELTDCGAGLKIVRTWTLLDWCTQETAQCVQVIKL